MQQYQGQSVELVRLLDGQGVSSDTIYPPISLLSTTFKLGEDVEVMWDEKLGEGNLSQVYKGRVTEQGREVGGIDSEFVAVKILFRPPQEIQKVYKEVEFLSSLENEFIVKIYGYALYEQGPIPYPCIVMEYLPENLKNYLLNIFVPFSVYHNMQWKLDLFKKIAQGLQYLHSKGVIHQNLKTKSILLVEPDIDDTPKIKICGIELKQNQWKYMALEQIYGRVDTSDDICELSDVVWKCLGIGFNKV